MASADRSAPWYMHKVSKLQLLKSAAYELPASTTNNPFFCHWVLRLLKPFWLLRERFQQVCLGCLCLVSWQLSRAIKNSVCFSPFTRMGYKIPGKKIQNTPSSQLSKSGHYKAKQQSKGNKKAGRKINKHKKSDVSIVKPKGWNLVGVPERQSEEMNYIVVEREDFVEEREIRCWILLWKTGLPQSWGQWRGKGAEGSPIRVSGCMGMGSEAAVTGLGARRGANLHLAGSAAVVPFPVCAFPGAIHEQCPLPKENQPDVTADAFSFYFWWPWCSQFSESLPNDSPGNRWQSSHWLQKGQGWAFKVLLWMMQNPSGNPGYAPSPH